MISYMERIDSKRYFEIKETEMGTSISMRDFSGLSIISNLTDEEVLNIYYLIHNFLEERDRNPIDVE